MMMMMQCLSLSSPPALPTTTKSSSFLSLFQTTTTTTTHSNHFNLHSHHNFNPNPLFRLGVNHGKVMPKQRRMRRSGGVVSYSASLLSPPNLHWASAVSTAVLMLVKGTAIDKSYLVPLFALQAPASVISWMQGEYGCWSAFLTILVRLFFFIPGELELPFITLVLAIVAPRQAMQLRKEQAGTIISLVIAAYLAFQHFTRAGSLQRSFDQGSLVATLAIICITVVPCLLLI